MSIADLRKLPPSEKFKIVQELWSDLVETPDEVPSPAWHEEELKKTEAEFAAGRQIPIDLAEAKKMLLGKSK
jgi:hypothetical protein